MMYRDEIYSLQILLSRTQAGPGRGRTVKQEQEEISPDPVQKINLISVCRSKILIFSQFYRYLNFSTKGARVAILLGSQIGLIIERAENQQS